MGLALGTELRRLTVSDGESHIADEAPPQIPLSVQRKSKTVKGMLVPYVEARGNARLLKRSIEKTMVETYYGEYSGFIASSLCRAVRRGNELVLGSALHKDDKSTVGIVAFVIKDDQIYIAYNSAGCVLLVQKSGPTFLEGAAHLDEICIEDSMGSSVHVHLHRANVEQGDLIIVAPDHLKRALGLRVIGGKLYGLSAEQTLGLLGRFVPHWEGSEETTLLAVEVREGMGHDQDTTNVRFWSSLRYSHPPKRRATGTPPRVPYRAAATDVEEDRRVERLAVGVVRNMEDDEAPVGGSHHPRTGGVRRHGRPRRRPSPWLFQGSRRYRWLLLPLAVLIVLVAILAMSAGGGARDQSGVLRILDQVENKEVQAGLAQDLGEKKRLLTEAIGLLDSGLSANPDEPNLRGARLRVASEMDAASGVQRAEVFPMVLDALGAGASSRATRVSLLSSRLLVLDSSAGRIIGGTQPVAMTTSSVVNGTVVYGMASSGDAAGRPVAMTTLAAGGALSEDAVAVLDDKGQVHLLHQDGSSEKVKLSLDGPLTDRSVLVSGYAGNLYLLDQRKGQLAWYSGNRQGSIDLPGFSYLNPPVQSDLIGAIDLEVGEGIFVLLEGGRIDRYAGGQRQAFVLQQPSVRLSKAGAISLGTKTNSLYVLDQAEQRVLRFDSDGTLRQELKAPPQSDLYAGAADIVVDEANNRLFVLNGGVVYQVRFVIAE